MHQKEYKTHNKSKNKPIVFVSFFLLLVISFIFICNKIHTNKSLTDSDTKKPNIITDNYSRKLLNINNLSSGHIDSHTLSVPHFSELNVSNGIYIPLTNLPYNDILLKYEVYDTEKNLVFKSSTPIKPNNSDKWYLDGYDAGVHRFIIIAYKIDEYGNIGNSVSFNTTLYIASTNDNNLQSQITTEIESSVVITVPDMIILNTNNSTYNVSVSGNISTTSIISIIPENSIVLTDGENNVMANVIQSKQQWMGAEIKESELTTSGSIEPTEDIISDTWFGNLNFNIKII